MKLAILFSGQGAQKPGMGLDFLSDPLFKRIITDGSQAAGLNLEKIMASRNGELKRTEFVQPALVAVSYGIFKMLQHDLPKIPVTAMAGLSLGENCALIASGSLAANDGLALLKDRGRYMQDDADQVKSTMAAVLKPDTKAVEAICDDLSQVWVANYNSPRQIVIGGVADQVKKAVTAIKDQGAGKRAVILRVSGAFHTPLFNGARQKMHQRLASVNFADPSVPVLSNTTVKPFQAGDIAEIMEHQLAVPTHFGEDVAAMVNDYDVDATLEIGPGKTLSHFAKQVNRGLKTDHIETVDDYQAYLEEHQSWK